MSDELHARVRAFIDGDRSASFEELALAIARFQAQHSQGFARLCALHGLPTSVSTIPAVPADAFRVTRVAVHPPEQDVVRFASSGTTARERSVHALRTTATYERAALGWGARALRADERRLVVVALAPEPSPDSSLGFMMKLFADHWDGRPRERWLISPAGVNLAALRAAARDATATNQPLLVLATSFALVALLDALRDERIEAPADTVVMQTGGYKGKSRELEPALLRRRVAEAFGVTETRVISEYGMTELTSQLYEGTLPGGMLDAGPNVLLPPPWLAVSAVDPVTLAELEQGEVGLARFVDLGNVDSAVAIVTQDLVRRRGPGIELLGRRPGAPARGCSLAIEALVASSGR
jgi:hypothetical protein